MKYLLMHAQRLFQVLHFDNLYLTHNAVILSKMVCAAVILNIVLFHFCYSILTNQANCIFIMLKNVVFCTTLIVKLSMQYLINLRFLIDQHSAFLSFG